MNQKRKKIEKGKAEGGGKIKTETGSRIFRLQVPTVSPSEFRVLDVNRAQGYWPLV
jgi:hypothetical protein